MPQRDIRSVNVVTLNQDQNGQRVLLHQRQDFRVWALPGGGVEPGENWDDAAVREAREETGYEIAIDRWVGEYVIGRTPQGRDTKRVYRAHVIGGAPIERGPETRQLGWFPVDDLPMTLNGLHVDYIHQALAKDAETVYATQRMPLWKLLLMYILIPLRDLYNRLTGHP
jgi:ADP-ribose pyrophosphatase YjhB (NUDIX family)